MRLEQDTEDILEIKDYNVMIDGKTFLIICLKKLRQVKEMITQLIKKILSYLQWI